MTVWYEDGQGFESDISSWEDENRILIELAISHFYTLPVDEVVNCVACIDTDENSELRDGDTGFAACYYT